jgi:hypothetical protein
MKGGDETTRKSSRGLPSIEIRTLYLGAGTPVIPGYNKQILTKEYIEQFIADKIKPGLQLVCLPMPSISSKPSESHSILVEVNESNTEVMIVDWAGETAENTKNKEWRNYTKFIKCLREKYGTLNYYEIDNDVYESAMVRCIANNMQGGCSQYVHNWIKKHIAKEDNKGKAKNAILLIEDL